MVNQFFDEHVFFTNGQKALKTENIRKTQQKNPTKNKRQLPNPKRSLNGQKSEMAISRGCIFNANGVQIAKIANNRTPRKIGVLQLYFGGGIYDIT